MVEPIVGVRPVVTAQANEMVNHDLWSAMAPAFGAYSTYKLHPLKGMVVVRLDQSMIWGVVDRYFGGTGDRPGPERTEFTRMEERLLARLSDGIMRAIVDSWADLLPMEMAPISRESDPQALSFADPSEQLLSQSFTVSVGNGEGWTIELLFPHQALRQLEPLFAPHAAADEPRHKDPLWQARMARQVAEVRFSSRAVVARPSLTLHELLNLKNGDIIPVSISRSVPLIVGNRLLAEGTVGEQNGRAAFMIEKISKEPTA